MNFFITTSSYIVIYPVLTKGGKLAIVTTALKARCILHSNLIFVYRHYTVNAIVPLIAVGCQVSNLLVAPATTNKNVLGTMFKIYEVRLCFCYCFPICYCFTAMSAMHLEIPPGSIKSKNFFVVGNDTEHFAVAIMRCWGICYVMYDTYTFGTASLTNRMVFFRKAQTAGAECQRSSLTAVYDLCWREQLEAS